MGSISSPSGPTIVGYTQEIITSEIADTRAAYLNARAVFSSAQAAFQADPSDPDLEALYESAISNLQGRATEYGTALARQQLFTDAEKAGDITSIISGSSAQIVPPSTGFEGLTSSGYGDLLTADDQKEAARTALVDAFNTYRFKEWEISSTRSQILIELARKEHALATGGVFDSSTLDSLNITLTSLLNTDRPLATAALDDALGDYSSTYGVVNTELLNAITAARTQAENWSSYIASQQASVEAHIDALLEAATSEDSTLMAEHVAATPDENDSFVEGQVGAASVTHAGALASLNASGTGNIAVNAPDTPVLLPASTRLTIGQLMSLISQVQRMIQELSRELGISDSKVNVLRRAIAQTDAEYFLKDRIAQNSWAEFVHSADVAYNARVNQDNVKNFSEAVDTYSAYQQNVPVINGVIDTINAEIDEQNARNKALVDAANAINTDVVDAINAARINKPEIANLLDYTDVDTDIPAPTLETVGPEISYPPDIPHYAHLDTFPDAPSVDLSTDPPTFPTQGELNEFNTSVREIAAAIAPFTERVREALVANVPELATTDPSSLDLHEIFLRERVTVRDSLVTPTFDGFLTFLAAFTRQLAAMSEADKAKKEERAGLLTSSLQRIEASLKTTITTSFETSGATFATDSISGGIGLGTADLEAKSSEVTRIVQQIATSREFSEILQSLFERLGIVAGIETAGILPEIAKELSKLGIPIQELLEGVDVGKVIENESTRALTTSFIGQLSGAALETDQLQNNAVQVLAQRPPIEGLSKEALEELINALVALQQLLLLLLAAFLGVSSGITPEEILDGFRGENPIVREFENSFKKLGVPLETIRSLFGTTGVPPESFVALLEHLGIDSPNQVALLLLLKAHEAGLSLREGVPGGDAFVDALLDSLRRIGIDLPRDITSRDFRDRLIQNLERIAEDRNLDIGVRALFTGELNTTIATTFPTTPPKETPPPISAPDILDELQRRFAALPDPAKEILIREARDRLGQSTTLSDENNAALLSALITKTANSQDIAALTALLQGQLGAEGIIGANAVELEIVQRLFRKSDEERLAEEDRAKYEEKMRPVDQQIKRPSTLPKQTRELMREAFEVTSRNFADERFADKMLTSFTNSIGKMTDFNRIVIDYLLDPGKLFLREFSIITRSSGERGRQTPIILGG